LLLLRFVEIKEKDNTIKYLKKEKWDMKSKKFINA